MPYIITTKRRWDDAAGGKIIGSRRAVVTLDEQQVYNALYKTPVHDKLDAAQRIAQLPESGGIITLPDGRIIEVRQPGMTERERVRLIARPMLSPRCTDQEWCDAYNALQGG